jgi:hypothetical protein
MQTNMTNKIIAKSVRNLDRRRLFSNIYENIQGLASLLGIHDQLVTPKKDISYKSQCKLWKGYELYLLRHIEACYDYWYKKYANKQITQYLHTINFKNIMKLKIVMGFDLDSPYRDLSMYPDWCTDETIQVHRSHLIQKDPEYYKKLWPEVPDNLEMHYEWNNEHK